MSINATDFRNLLRWRTYGTLLILCLTFISNIIYGPGNTILVLDTVKPISQALEEYEAEHEFARCYTLPVEDRPPGPADQVSGYRWFRSPNIVCLEKYRILKTSGRL
jgi:hypothetical protein